MRLDDTPRTSPEAQPATAPSWRRVAVPTEHGGWSLTAEPILLGLLVAPSWSGAALGGAAMLAFVARTPLKVVLVDRFRHRWLERTSLAARIAAVEIVAIVALGLVAALLTSNRWFWLPLAAAVPLIGVELWADMRSRSRRLIPELCGTVGIGAVVAAIVLADGGRTSLALGMWAVISARAVAAIPYARAQVFRAHRRPTPWWHSDLAQIVAVAAVVAAWLLGGAPLASVVVIAVIAVFNAVAVRGPVLRAVVVGAQQSIFGVLVVIVTAVAVLT